MRFLKMFFVLGLLSMGIQGCGGGGGCSGVATATGVFADRPVEGIEYTSGSISGVTGLGGTFTYEVGKSVTFKVGNLVIGSATGAATITPLELAKTLNASYGMTEATKIAQLLQSLDDGTGTSGCIKINTTSITNAGASMATKNLLSDDLQTILTTLKPGAILVSSSTALAELNTTQSNLGLLKHSGEYVSADLDGHSAVHFLIKPDGSIRGVSGNVYGDLYYLKGTVSSNGTFSVQQYTNSAFTGTPRNVTITGTSDGAGAVTGTVVDNPSSATYTFRFTRINKTANQYYGLYRGTFTGTNNSSGTTGMAIDSSGRLYGYYYSYARSLSGLQHSS